MHTIIPDEHTNAVMNYLATIADKALTTFGISHDASMAILLYAVIVLIVAIVVGLICRYIILVIARAVCNHSRYAFLKMLHTHLFFRSITTLIPAIVYLMLLNLTYTWSASLTHLLSTLTIIYIIVRFIIGANKFIDTSWLYFDSKQNKRKLPLRSIAQLAKGILWIIGIIVSIAILVNKSPAALLAGLGAFAAVILLIFKDSILGVVAGVQLSMEDSLHVGDWIKVQGTNADGVVEEANLISIKVKNWDNTTTMLPPYSLVSGSYTNYRSMISSGCRRIYRSYNIDAKSVHRLTTETLDRYRKIDFMDEFITKMLSNEIIADTDKELISEELADGSIETNLGLFRAYLRKYILNSTCFNHEELLIVGTEQQGALGIPLFVYCFTATANWIAYTDIQSALFEHISIMLPEFDLRIFQPTVAATE